MNCMLMYIITILYRFVLIPDNLPVFKNACNQWTAHLKWKEVCLDYPFSNSTMMIVLGKTGWCFRCGFRSFFVDFFLLFFFFFIYYCRSGITSTDATHHLWSGLSTICLPTCFHSVVFFSSEMRTNEWLYMHVKYF